MIVITGMHRSGTSLVCQLLHALGVDFGDPAGLYGPDKWNEEGYFESRAVMDVNSRIVTGFTRTGSSAARLASMAVYITMPSQAALGRRAAAHHAELCSVAAAHAHMACKDPRFCLTLPHWRDVVPVEKTVVCIRHPSDVARSLAHRQHVPRWLALRFWRYHFEALLAALDVERSVLVDFDRLRGEEGDGELGVLTRFLGLDAGEAERRRTLDAVFRDTLVHASEHDRERIPERDAALWRKLCTLADERRAAIGADR